MLEGYRFLEELGRGGQGSVHRVVEEATGAERAIKVLERELDPESVERFRREAQALARLGGQGVVAVHRFGVEGKRLFFVMDLMRGGSLEARVRGGSTLAWREATILVAKLARTLARAHAAGLVHRDMKPQNILFDDAGEPRLTDFGCVRDLQLSRLTETGTVVGTPAYMAPEQLEGRPVGPAADVFALGVILQELLTGERPFVGNTAASLFLAMRGKRPRIGRREAPVGLDLLLDRVLARDPAARPDASTLAAALETIAASSVETSGTRARWALLALVAIALVAAGVELTRPSASTGAAPKDDVSHVRPERPAAIATHAVTREESADALAAEAEACLDRLDWRRARDLGSKAAERSPNMRSVRVVQLKLAILAGPPEAIFELDRPENALLRSELRPFLEAAQGNGESSAQVVSWSTMRLDIVGEDENERGQLLLRRGRARAMRGQHAEAIGDFSLALAFARRLVIREMEAEALWRRGVSRRLRQELDLSLDDLSAAIALNDVGQYRLDRAKAYAASGLHAEARDDLDRYVDLSGPELARDAERRREVASAYVAAGDSEKARRILSRETR